MNKPLSNEALTQLCEFLLKRSDEAFARAETMRLLLLKHGVFPQAEFDALFAQQVANRKDATSRLTDEWSKQAHSEELRRFLESFEGTAQ